MNEIVDSPESIFGAAIEIASADERQAFLARACGKDEELLKTIERLLRAHFQAGSFLESPVLEVASTADLAPLVEHQGSTIGPYTLVQQIGEGGFGVVFLAQQQRPVRRRVALKVIKPGMDSRQVIARFEAERQALAMMDHPNIAKVLDAGTVGATGRAGTDGTMNDLEQGSARETRPDAGIDRVDQGPARPAGPTGRPYFVMELVQGVPITEYCDQCSLTTRERLELFVTVCQAVQHAHQKGIIHRDIKPSNVMVAMQDGRPTPKIIDFGVAKAIGQQLTEHTLITAYAQMVGTPLYMSPEQAELSPLGVDTRSDIYSLGVLLYELLTGTTPFDKERLHTASYDEIRRIIREEEPPRPSTRISTLAVDLATTMADRRRTDARHLAQQVRGELDWIVMKCLEKDRNRRYDSVGHLARDVECYLNDEPVQACPPSAGYRLQKFVRRNKVSFFTAFVLAVAAVVTLFILTLSNARIARERNEKDRALKEKISALEIAREREREATDQLFLSLFNHAKANRRGRQMGQQVESLSALAQAARIRTDEALRDEAIAAMALSDVRCGPALQISLPRLVTLSCDRQYEHYVRLDEYGALSVRNLLDDREIQRVVPVSHQGRGELQSLLFSPDGLLVASRIDDTLQVWRVSDGQLILTVDSTTCPPAFSPDGRHMAVGTSDWAVCYDLATGKDSDRWQLPESANAMAYDPDGHRLAIAYVRSNIVSVFQIADRATKLFELPVGPSTILAVAWDSDGNRLAVGCDSNIQIWDVNGERKLATLSGHVQPVTGLAFHPDGALLVSTSWDGVVRVWNAASGRTELQIPVLLIQLQFSKDNRWFGVALDGHKIHLLELIPTRVYRTFVSSLGAEQGGYRDGAFSPDGRLLAVGMDEGTRLWDVINGRELAHLLGHSVSVFFRRTGRELLTCGPGEVRRWQIEHMQDSPCDLHFGPALPIPIPIVPHRAAVDADGKLVAIVSEVDGEAVTVKLPARATTGGESVHEGLNFSHAHASFVALSPNGRWLATAGWHADRVRLWDTQTGRMVHEWYPSAQSQVFFTPDSRALIIARGDDFTFWKLTSLEPIHRIHRDVMLYPGHVAFSPDGRLMGMEMAPGVIHLKDVATARTVARLEDPNGDRATWIGFTPDGTQLAVVAHYARAVHLWDLREIRTQLKPMGLDWDWPPFATTDSHNAGSPPGEPILQVTVRDSISLPEQPPTDK